MSGGPCGVDSYCSGSNSVPPLGAVSSGGASWVGSVGVTGAGATRAPPAPWSSRRRRHRRRSRALPPPVLEYSPTNGVEENGSFGCLKSPQNLPMTDFM